VGVSMGIRLILRISLKSLIMACSLMVFPDLLNLF
jgi:hypothetical protein